MKIAGILDNQFFLSGVNAYWSAMLNSLDLMGHHPHTIVLDSGECPWNDGFYRMLKGTVHRLVLSPEAHTRMARSREIFSRIGPDIVFHHYSDTGIDLSTVLKKEAVGNLWQDIYICHSDDPDHYKRIDERREQLSHVLCVSETCREKVVKHLDFPEHNTSLHNYYFVPPEDTPAEDTPTVKALNSLDPVRLLYAGRLEQYQKRAGDLVLFIDALYAARVAFVLNISGSGGMEDDLKKALEHPVRKGHVVFHGYLDPPRLYGLMKESHIFINFSEFEGLSTSLVQAMAFGMIPILTETESGTGFLRHGGNALFFHVGNVRAAAGHVKSIATGAYPFSAMAKEAQTTIESRFNVAASVRQLSAFLPG